MISSTDVSVTSINQPSIVYGNYLSISVGFNLCQLNQQNLQKKINKISKPNWIEVEQIRNEGKGRKTPYQRMLRASGRGFVTERTGRDQDARRWSMCQWCPSGTSCSPERWGGKEYSSWRRGRGIPAELDSSSPLKPDFIQFQCKVNCRNSTTTNYIINRLTKKLSLKSNHQTNKKTK